MPRCTIKVELKKKHPVKICILNFPLSHREILGQRGRADETRVSLTFRRSPSLDVDACPQLRVTCVFFPGQIMTTRHRLSCEMIRRQRGFWCSPTWIWTSQVELVVKNLPDTARDVRDMGSFPGSGRCPGGGNGNPLQHYFLIYVFILIVYSHGGTGA